MNYLGVIKNEDGVWEIKREFHGGTNIYGNKTGTLWHNASQMSLQERIDEGIFLKVNTTQGYDPEFAQLIRTDVTFDDVKAEVVYTDVYELIDLQTIKDTLKARAHVRRTYEANKTLLFKGQEFSLDYYMMNILNGYSSVIALGGTLPVGAILPTKHGVSEPLTQELLLEIQTFIAEHNNAVNKKYVEICENIQAATTYEDMVNASIWNDTL